MYRALPAFLLAAGVAMQPPPAEAQPKAKTGPSYAENLYGKMPDTKDAKGKVSPGPRVTEYTLTNRNGMVVKCVEIGAIITEIHVPDKDGKFADVALGFDKFADYQTRHPYFGANAGRCANRIAKGKFSIDGKEFTLATNNGKNHLHGGEKGFDTKYWKGEPFLGATGPGVKFTYRSPDGEEGYPGNLSVTMSYTLTDNNEIVVDYRATTDKPTVCNLAHHSYFNLAGHNSGDILGHVVQIDAKDYTPADETLVPSGKIAPVAKTPFDFTKDKPIGKDLKEAGGDPVGFDLNYVLDKGTTERPEFAAAVFEPKSGRTLVVLTTEPGLQFYTGNFLDGKTTGKGGTVYKQHSSFCMEP
jgi:aldose 1-epimerase